jgi:hypothetical protein
MRPPKSMEVSYRTRLDLLMEDPDRKSMVQMLYEMVCLWLRHGIRPTDYYGNLMFKKYVTNMRDYVSGLTAYEIRKDELSRISQG